ncbi:hypothetical protein [Methylobacterium sp. JK268]
MTMTTHLSPDEVEAYALAGEEALNVSLGRQLPEMQAAFWHAIQCCYVRSPSPIPVPDLAIVPDPVVLPPAHVIQAAVELQ